MDPEEVWLIVWTDAGGQTRINGFLDEIQANRVLANMKAAAFPNEVIPDRVSGPYTTSKSGIYQRTA